MRIKGDAKARAVVGLVYRDEGGGVDCAWGRNMEFNMREHPAKNVIGIYVVRIDGLSGESYGGKASVTLTPTQFGYQLAVEGVEGLQTIPVSDAYFEVCSHGTTLKMPLSGGEALGLRVEVDENGKLYSKLKNGSAFYDLDILGYCPELKNYNYEPSPGSPQVTLRDVLAIEYVGAGGEIRKSLISVTGKS